jgi:hypothetical protein
MKKPVPQLGHRYKSSLFFANPTRNQCLLNGQFGYRMANEPVLQQRIKLAGTLHHGCVAAFIDKV